MEESKQLQTKVPRRSTLGLSNFKVKRESSPYGDRFIPKRKDQDSNVAFYEINHEDSPPHELDRDRFDNSIEYEEKLKLYNDKVEYDEMLKVTLWNNPSPSKDTEDD